MRGCILDCFAPTFADERTQQSELLVCQFIIVEKFLRNSIRDPVRSEQIIEQIVQERLAQGTEEQHYAHVRCLWPKSVFHYHRRMVRLLNKVDQNCDIQIKVQPRSACRFVT